MKAERRKKHDKNLIKSRTSNKLHKFGDPIFLNHFVFYSSIYIEIMNSPKHKKSKQNKKHNKGTGKVNELFKPLHSWVHKNRSFWWQAWKNV